MLVNSWILPIVAVVQIAISKCLELITFSEQSMVFMKIWHFLSFRVTPALFQSSESFLVWPMWSPNILKNISISSKFTSENGHSTVAKITFMLLWKVPGAFCGPNGTRMKRRSPSRDVNIIILSLVNEFLSGLPAFIFQYALHASSVEETTALTRVSIHALIRGIRYVPRFVAAFRFQYPMQNRRCQSLLGANTTGAPIRLCWFTSLLFQHFVYLCYLKFPHIGSCSVGVWEARLWVVVMQFDTVFGCGDTTYMTVPHRLEFG